MSKPSIVTRTSGTLSQYGATLVYGKDMCTTMMHYPKLLTDSTPFEEIPETVPPEMDQMLWAMTIQAVIDRVSESIDTLEGKKAELEGFLQHYYDTGEMPVNKR